MTRLLAVVLVLAFVTPVFGEAIQNGSFEDSSGGTGWVTSIAKWTLTPSTTVAGQNAGIFFKVNGFSPADGQKYAGLTNNGAVTQTMAATTFTITNERIDFDWIYVTNNALGDVTHKDPFTVTLATTDSQGNVTTTVWTVSNVDDSGLKTGTVGAAPWGGGTTYDTQAWQTFTIDTTNLQGQTALLTFAVVDSATGGSVTGVFLDDVTHIPEPSTFLLFGLGFVGMALYGRRKMKKK